LNIPKWHQLVILTSPSAKNKINKSTK
jgi:hypothetical protein